MFHFDLAGEDSQFARGCCLLEVDAIVDRDARLEMRDVDKGRAQILSQSLELGRALMRGWAGPTFQAQENKDDDRRDDEGEHGQRRRPGESSRSFRARSCGWLIVVHAWSECSFVPVGT